MWFELGKTICLMQVPVGGVTVQPDLVFDFFAELRHEAWLRRVAYRDARLSPLQTRDGASLVSLLKKDALWYGRLENAAWTALAAGRFNHFCTLVWLFVQRLTGEHDVLFSVKIEFVWGVESTVSP